MLQQRAKCILSIGFWPLHDTRAVCNAMAEVAKHAGAHWQMEVLERMLAVPGVRDAPRSDVAVCRALQDATVAAARVGDVRVLNRLLADPRVDASADRNAALAATLWSPGGVHFEAFTRLLDAPGMNVEGAGIFNYDSS